MECICECVLPLDLDYTLIQSVINFGPTDTSQTISIITVDDKTLEYIEIFTMSIVITDDLSEIGILPGENSVISVYIRDNDSKAMHYVHALSCIISGVTAALSVSDSNVKEGNKCKVTVSLNQAANTKIGFLISSITMTATGIQFVLHLMLM